MPSQSSGICFSDNMARFSHILQPIRDLTKNWDIDVATQLEEYLSEIEKIRISFDNGRTTMNFAEAALLIQGSACVYSKKVEYLYTLVYQTLDLISSKKRLQQASSVDNHGQDKDATFKDQEEEFLPLDDIVEAKNIDLEEDENINNEFSQVIPRTPMALIKLSDKDKGDMLLSRTGEVLGSRLDFKMNTCTVHSSGALLLDLSHLSLLDNSFKRLPSSTPQVNIIPTTQPVLATNDCGPQNLENDYFQQACPVPDDAMNDSDDDADPVMPNDDYGVYEGNDFQQTSATHNIESEQGNEECCVALRPRTEPQPPVTVQNQQIRDPWKVLDPHEQSLKANLKPFKNGRPFRIPLCLRAAIETKGRKKRKRSDNEDSIDKLKTPTIPLAEFISQAFYSHASKCPRNPLHAPKFQEFEYLYWVEFRKRQAFLKRERKRLVQLLTPEQFKDINLVPGDKEQDDEEHEGADSPVDDENDEGDYFGGCNDDFPDAEEENVAPIEPVGLEDQEDELVVSSYESLVRKHVQGFLSNAAQYAQETDLSRRVRDWEEKIKPKLQAEDSHRPFDIHKYGEEVLASFKESPQKMFKDIVKEKEPFEICRHFLATLQLANNYNVEITSSGDEQNAIDTMALKLLHKTPAHKAIASYRAPSVLT